MATSVSPYLLEVVVTLTEAGLLLAGIAMVAYIMIDSLWTTVMPQGAGPLTLAFCQLISRMFRSAPDGLRARLRPLQGGTCLLAVILIWVVVLWGGWWLIFMSDPGSVMNSQTGAPAQAGDRLYFAGFTLFTLGIGDFHPNGGLWQFLTAFSSINGLFLVTLSITYILSVLSAANQKRQLATMINNLGDQPEEIVLRTWDGKGFPFLLDQLSNNFWPMIHLHTQHHHCFPVLHYFHGSGEHNRLAPNLANLDDALSIILLGLRPSARPPACAIISTRKSISLLLKTLEKGYVNKPDKPLSPPTLTRLAQAGVPLVTVEQFHRELDHLTDHRRRMKGFVEHN